MSNIVLNIIIFNLSAITGMLAGYLYLGPLYYRWSSNRRKERR